MRCRVEKFWAYAVLLFVIILSFMFLSDNRDRGAVGVEMETDWDSLFCDFTCDNVAVASIPTVKYRADKLTAAYIIVVMAALLLLYLYLFGKMAVCISGGCVLPVLRVVRYIHNSDGEKSSQLIFG